MRKVKDSEMDTMESPSSNYKFSNFSIDALISPRNLSNLSPFLNLSPWIFPMPHGISGLSGHSAFSPYAGLTSPHLPLSSGGPPGEVAYSHHHQAAIAAAAAAAAAAMGPVSSTSNSSSTTGGGNLPVPTIPEDLTLARLGGGGSLFNKSFSVQDYLAKTNQFLSSAMSASLNPLHSSLHHHHHLQHTQSEGQIESGSASSGELSPSSSSLLTTRVPKSSSPDASGDDTNSSPPSENLSNGKKSAFVSHHNLHPHQHHLSPLVVDSASSPHAHSLFAHHFHNNLSGSGLQVSHPSPPGCTGQSHHGVPESPPNTPGTSPSGKCHSYSADSPLPLSG